MLTCQHLRKVATPRRYRGLLALSVPALISLTACCGSTASHPASVPRRTGTPQSSATRSAGTNSLASCQRAHAELTSRQIADTCRKTAAVRGYRISLPGKRAAVFVDQPGRACRRADQGRSPCGHAGTALAEAACRHDTHGRRRLL